MTNGGDYTVVQITLLLCCLKNSGEKSNGTRLQFRKGCVQLKLGRLAWLLRSPTVVCLVYTSTPSDRRLCIDANLIDHIAQRRRQPAGMNSVNARPIVPLSVESPSFRSGRDASDRGGLARGIAAQLIFAV